MNERSSRATAEGASNAGPQIKSRISLREVVPVALALLSTCAVHAQSTAPAARPAAPKAIYTPKPVYRAEWAKQRLTGKGVVLVTIDKKTGNVTGARMLTSTGNQQLDGAALQAYSQWRFDPGTVVVPQLQIPIEFATRPVPQSAKPSVPQSWILLIVLVAGGVAVAVLRRRRA